MTQTAAERTGANVRAEMARQGVSQVALAADLDMAQTAVSKRLRGVTPFTVPELLAVAELLHVPAAVLLAEQPAPPAAQSAAS